MNLLVESFLNGLAVARAHRMGSQRISRRGDRQRTRVRAAVAATIALLVAAIGVDQPLGAATPANVDADRIEAADRDATKWPRGGRGSADKGDNLFLPSIVALSAGTEAYLWRYQATPGEERDFDAVQQLILVDLTIKGQRRRVLLQTHKNGVVDVLDRRTGELISAQTSSRSIRRAVSTRRLGRPIENPGIRYGETTQQARMMPGPLSAHSSQPMAYNPNTGLVYIPAQEIGQQFVPVKDFKPSALVWNIGVAARSTPGAKGRLLAWKRVHQKEAWPVEYLGSWNGRGGDSAGTRGQDGDKQIASRVRKARSPRMSGWSWSIVGVDARHE